MIEQEAFLQIDIAIKGFKQKEGLYKGIKVSKTPPGGWLIFNWRQLTWKENEINYLIEIFPNFSQQEKILDWTMYAAAYFDQDNRRYYISQTFAEHKEIEFIAGNATALMLECFNYLIDIKKSDIPITLS